MRGCDSSSKALNLTPRFASNVPGFWREPFASSDTTSPSLPSTQLCPKPGCKYSGGVFRRSFQRIAMVDKDTGEQTKWQLLHGDGEAHPASRPSTGPAQ